MHCCHAVLSGSSVMQNVPCMLQDLTGEHGRMDSNQTIFCWPMTPFHPVAGNLPIKTLVAKQQPTNNVTSTWTCRSTTADHKSIPQMQLKLKGGQNGGNWAAVHSGTWWGNSFFFSTCPPMSMQSYNIEPHLLHQAFDPDSNWSGYV